MNESGEIREITEDQPLKENEVVLSEAEAKLLSLMSEQERAEYAQATKDVSDEDRERASKQIMAKALAYAQAQAKHAKKHVGEVVLPPLRNPGQWRFRTSKNAADYKRLKRTGTLKRRSNG